MKLSVKVLRASLLPTDLKYRRTNKTDQAFKINLTVHSYFSITVKLGDYLIEKGHNSKEDAGKDDAKQAITVDGIFIHPNYQHIKKTFFNDIALVKLKHEAKLEKYVRTVCLPKNAEDDSALPKSVGYVTGWGYTRKLRLGGILRKNFINSRVLRHISVPIQTNKACRKSLNNRHAFNATISFCAGDGKGKKDACPGDSGGPFVREKYNGKLEAHRWTQVGIVSWGEGCGQKKTFGFYTRVAPYIGWIRDKMKHH